MAKDVPLTWHCTADHRALHRPVYIFPPAKALTLLGELCWPGVGSVKCHQVREKKPQSLLNYAMQPPPPELPSTDI